jgi:hypothetical protein
MALENESASEAPAAGESGLFDLAALPTLAGQAGRPEELGQ